MHMVTEYIALKNQGYTYQQIADMYKTSKAAVRNAIRRHNQKTTGVYSGKTSPTPKTPRLRDMKILTLDIETAPATAWVWQAKTDYVPMSQTLEQGRILCWAAKWMDEPTMFASEWTQGREQMLRSMWSLLDQADIVITYNGDSYDIPYLNWEFKLLGLPRYAPFKSIDLIKTVRKHFRPMYKKLDFLTQSLLGSRKVDNGGIQLWKDLLLDNKPEAQAMMKTYNVQDTVITEDLYLDLLPWIDNHPPVILDSEKVLCRACGSDNLERAGWKTALMLRYPMYKCAECGSFSRTTVGRERITNTYGI